MGTLVSSAWAGLGKGTGFFFIAFASLGAFTVVMLRSPAVDPIALGLGIGSSVAAYFAGGGWKAHAEAKAGGKNEDSQTPAA